MINNNDNMIINKCETNKSETENIPKFSLTVGNKHEINPNPNPTPYA